MAYTAGFSPSVTSWHIEQHLQDDFIKEYKWAGTMSPSVRDTGNELTKDAAKVEDWSTTPASWTVGYQGSGWTDFYGDGGLGGAQPVYRGEGGKDKSSCATLPCNTDTSNQVTIPSSDCWRPGFTDFYGGGAGSQSPALTPASFINNFCGDGGAETDASGGHTMPVLTCMGVQRDGLFVSDAYAASSSASSSRGDGDAGAEQIIEGLDVLALQEPVEHWEKALEVAAQCLAVEEGEVAGVSETNVWELATGLWPVMSFAALPKLAPPLDFMEAMETYRVCLLLAPAGSDLVHLERLVEMMDSSPVAPLLRYLDELEAVLHEASANPDIHWEQPGRDASQLALFVGSALSDWPMQHEQLRKRALALWSAIMTYGPAHQQRHLEWRRAADERKSIQQQQEKTCIEIVQDLEGAVKSFSGQMLSSADGDLPDIANATHMSLMSIRELADESLERQQKSWMNVMQECKKLDAKVDDCYCTVQDARLEVQNHAQDLIKELQCFSEVAYHLVAWKSILAPQLQLLDTCRDEMRMAVQLQSQLRALEENHVIAEDRFDTAQTQLRKVRRHAQKASQSCCTESLDTNTRFYENRVAETGEQAAALRREIQNVQEQLQQIENVLPLAVRPIGQANAVAKSALDILVWPEGEQTLKLLELQQERDEALRQVAERDDALKQITEKLDFDRNEFEAQVEQDFMCPITHEKMQEPVVAADGHTYERRAIEKWMRESSTSPMTGAPLTHRYLTTNFSLRRIIAVYEARSDIPGGNE